MNFNEALMNFMDLVEKRDLAHMTEKFPNLKPNEWDVSFGRKYVKVIRDRSVYAFIEVETGDIYKPASWSAPAKHVRGNIYGENPLAGTDIYGVNYLV